MTSRRTYLGQQQLPKTIEIKDKIQGLVEQQEDPQLLAELFRVMNQFLDQTNLRQQELLAVNTRYNGVSRANKERTRFAHSWLERKNPLFYAANSKRPNLDGY